MNQLAQPRIEFGDTISEPRSLEGRWVLLRFLLIVSATAMPLLSLRLPGNSGPVDIVNAVIVAFGAAVLVRTRAQLRVPMAVPMFMILLGGLLATMQSIAIDRSFLALTQDIYLFVVFIIIVNLIAQDRSGLTVRFLAGAWAATGVACGAIVWAVKLTETSHLLGIRMIDPYGRAHAMLWDPNMAGVFLVTSLFVLWLSPWPRSIPTKLWGSVPILMGIYATSSNTALFTLVGGALATLAVALIARQSKGAGRTAATAVLVGVVALMVVVVPGAATQADQSLDALGQTEAFKSSLGRVESSLEPRVDRWIESLDLFRNELVVGIGPSATNEWLDSIHARIGGEIHNDYVAGFLERGLLGGVGNLLLFALVTAAAIRVSLNDRLRGEGWLPASALGAIVSVLLAANALEVLHFRHVWMLFAMLVGLQIVLTGPRDGSEAQT